ncbi:phosphoadenosine phosphosulfate reductase [Labrys miyagiensis]|uniref:Adenosine 5'-phosphosulfate reductase n=1 Tax=Labrys miyagiensis TaxID=346912 RepID=A0ABQ6CHY7_9HYPH|nr:phosphoadenylyl-sulfate reductase [Labrys miyagiensis]GLS19252.1 phosphoadenosine phosphosulfate reductase [Labrys miyagiensis]
MDSVLDYDGAASPMESLLVEGNIDPEAQAIALAAQYHVASAQDILKAALSLYGGRIALVSSFGAESAALLHMVAEIDRSTPVIFLDTGRLFSQTLLYRNELARRLGLTDLRTAKPRAALVQQEDPDRLLAYRDPDMCCWIRKVDPLDTALEPFSAWITGRKRHQAATRAALKPFEAESGRIKVNPLAGWTTQDVTDYLDRYDLPPHPLVADGYPSIGCMPCTSRVAEGEDARAGRWRGKGKIECGIHVTPEKSGSGI